VRVLVRVCVSKISDEANVATYEAESQNSNLYGTIDLVFAETAWVHIVAFRLEYHDKRVCRSNPYPSKVKLLARLKMRCEN